MANFARCSAVVCESFSVQPEIVAIEGYPSCPRTCCVYTPKRGAMIGSVVEEARLVEVWTDTPKIKAPGARLTLDLEPVKTLSNIRPFAYRDKAARTIVQFLSAGLQRHPVVISAGA